MQALVGILIVVLSCVSLAVISLRDDVQQQCSPVKATVTKVQTKGKSNYIVYRYAVDDVQYEFVEKSRIPFIREGMHANLYVNAENPDQCLPLANRLRTRAALGVTILFLVAGIALVALGL